MSTGTNLVIESISAFEALKGEIENIAECVDDFLDSVRDVYDDTRGDSNYLTSDANIAAYAALKISTDADKLAKLEDCIEEGNYQGANEIQKSINAQKKREAKEILEAEKESYDDNRSYILSDIIYGYDSDRANDVSSRVGLYYRNKKMKEISEDIKAIQDLITDFDDFELNIQKAIDNLDKGKYPSAEKLHVIETKTDGTKIVGVNEKYGEDVPIKDATKATVSEVLTVSKTVLAANDATNGGVTKEFIEAACVNTNAIIAYAYKNNLLGESARDIYINHTESGKTGAYSSEALSEALITKLAELTGGDVDTIKETANKYGLSTASSMVGSAVALSVMGSDIGLSDKNLNIIGGILEKSGSKVDAKEYVEQMRKVSGLTEYYGLEEEKEEIGGSKKQLNGSQSQGIQPTAEEETTVHTESNDKVEAPVQEETTTPAVKPADKEKATPKEEGTSTTITVDRRSSGGGSSNTPTVVSETPSSAGQEATSNLLDAASDLNNSNTSDIVNTAVRTENTSSAISDPSINLSDQSVQELSSQSVFDSTASSSVISKENIPAAAAALTVATEGSKLVGNLLTQNTANTLSAAYSDTLSSMSSNFDPTSLAVADNKSVQTAKGNVSSAKAANDAKEEEIEKLREEITKRSGKDMSKWSEEDKKAYSDALDSKEATEQALKDAEQALQDEQTKAAEEYEKTLTDPVEVTTSDEPIDVTQDNGINSDSILNNITNNANEISVMDGPSELTDSTFAINPTNVQIDTTNTSSNNALNIGKEALNTSASKINDFTRVNNSGEYGIAIGGDPTALMEGSYSDNYSKVKEGNDSEEPQQVEPTTSSPENTVSVNNGVEIENNTTSSHTDGIMVEAPSVDNGEINLDSSDDISFSLSDDGQSLSEVIISK